MAPAAHVLLAALLAPRSLAPPLQKPRVPLPASGGWVQGGVRTVAHCQSEPTRQSPSRQAAAEMQIAQSGRTQVDVGEQVVVHPRSVAVGVDVHSLAAAVDLRRREQVGKEKVTCSMQRLNRWRAGQAAWRRWAATWQCVSATAAGKQIRRGHAPWSLQMSPPRGRDTSARRCQSWGRGATDNKGHGLHRSCCV